LSDLPASTAENCKNCEEDPCGESFQQFTNDWQVNLASVASVTGFSGDQLLEETGKEQ